MKVQLVLPRNVEKIKLSRAKERERNCHDGGIIKCGGIIKHSPISRFYKSSVYSKRAFYLSPNEWMSYNR